jgi:acyl-CoA thioester hydrolase
MNIYNHRVTYDEVDGQKIVFNSHYLKWCDHATYEFFRKGGFPPFLLEEIGMDFVVRKATVEYNSPAFFDDTLTFIFSIEEIGNTSYEMKIRILNESDENVADITIKHVNVHSGKATPIPDEIREYLYSF